MTVLASPTHLQYRRLRLVVIEGEERGKTVAFADGRVRVGARRENELALSDALVSGLHLEISVEASGVRLRDLGSTNGTFVGGLRTFDIYLQVGTEIRIGRTLLRLETGEDSEAVALHPERSFGPLVGGSSALRAIFTSLERIAKTSVPALIMGETGTGKEVVARAIHEASARASEPFLAVDCAAIPASLIESELFGFERGAFTGADRAFPGAFERAGAGTILLDELGELPLAVQPKLLRALDSLQIRRLGSERTRPIAARILGATNRDLARMVNQGTFRDDLYYRLAVAEIHLPPLRERREDIPLLVTLFLSRIDDPSAKKEIDAETLAGLCQHSWPGNVRELRNAVQRIALLGESGPPRRAGQPVVMPEAPARSLPMRFDLPYKQARDLVLGDFRERYLRAVLDRAGGAIAQAARMAGVDRMTFYRLLKPAGSKVEGE